METTEKTETPEGFVINSKDRAEWYLSKLAYLEHEEQLVAAQAEKMLQRLRSDRESLTGRFGSQLENFVRESLESGGGKRKSVVFFHGTASFRTSPPRLVVESEADALQTARLVCPGAIVEIPASEKLDKKVLGEYAKRRLVEEGEIIPGYGLTEAREVFDVKLPSAGKAQEGGEE